MIEETFKKISAIEEEARKSVEAAEKFRIHALNSARKRAEEVLLETEQEALREGQMLIENAGRQAEAEKQKIEQETSAEIEGLRKKTLPKIAEAKKLCR